MKARDRLVTPEEVKSWRERFSADPSSLYDIIYENQGRRGKDYIRQVCLNVRQFDPSYTPPPFDAASRRKYFSDYVTRNPDRVKYPAQYIPGSKKRKYLQREDPNLKYPHTFTIFYDIPDCQSCSKCPQKCEPTSQSGSS